MSLQDTLTIPSGPTTANRRATATKRKDDIPNLWKMNQGDNRQTRSYQSSKSAGSKSRRRKNPHQGISMAVGAFVILILLLFAIGVLITVVQSFRHSTSSNPLLRSNVSPFDSMHKRGKLQDVYTGSRNQPTTPRGEMPRYQPQDLLANLESMNHFMVANEAIVDTVYEVLFPWRERLLVELDPRQPLNPYHTQVLPKVSTPQFSPHGQFFRVTRQTSHHRPVSASTDSTMKWEGAWKSHQLEHPEDLGPYFDYTRKEVYRYPQKQLTPPAAKGPYPHLQPLKDLFADWPQDDIDRTLSSNPNTIVEHLQHFDYQNQTEVEAAERYKAEKLPFKFTNVPDLLQTAPKWKDDDYISQFFDGPSDVDGRGGVQGKCQESASNFFAFFQPKEWNVEILGMPPTRTNDWSYKEFAQHARYADAKRLNASQPHFYWQVGVPTEERELMNTSQWSFVSRDLPSFSSSRPTTICDSPQHAKGIQCRFGERGVVAATHYDGGKNMVGMIFGAKRYILHPPSQCPNLSIVTQRSSSIHRHSPLNLGHLSMLDSSNQPTADGAPSPKQTAWLQRASQSQAVETVLKEGEALFIPSHWFHYIISLQRNAQCNVRSGVDLEGDTIFGNGASITPEQCDPRRFS